VVNFETWDRYHRWASHIRGATALLELRGKKQFDQELGGQLYIQIRTQIVRKIVLRDLRVLTTSQLATCMQEGFVVPPALVKAAYDFQSSRLRKEWHGGAIASAGSIFEISVRLVNLFSWVKNPQISDFKTIKQRAIDIDADLDTWAHGVPSSWAYDVIRKKICGGVTEDFNSESHVYPNVWIAAVWVGWRTLKILVHQILIQVQDPTVPGRIQPSDDSILQIQRFSKDICVTIRGFRGTSCECIFV
jgi:hypothetical protein